MNDLINIETQRLIIRPFEKKDLNSFIAFMLDEESTRFLMFSDDQKTRSGATQLFEMIITSYKTSSPVHSYVIALKDDRYIGSCGFSPLFGLDHIVECYYSLLPKYTHKGYATEALLALIDFCFKKFNIDEIRAYMHPQNPSSEGVAKRVNMQYLGIKSHPQFKIDGKLYVIKKINFESNFDTEN